jgi:hypothetical protein
MCGVFILPRIRVLRVFQFFFGSFPLHTGNPFTAVAADTHNVLYPRRIPVPNRLRPRTATAFSSAAAATGIFVSRSEFVHYFDYYYVIIFIAIADTMSVNPSLPPPPPPRQSSATPPRTYSRAFRLCHRYSCKSRRPCRCKLATSADPAASVVVRLVAAA